MSIASQVEDIAKPIAEAKGAYLVGVILSGERGSPVVEILIDTDQGISTNLCAEISREISRLLDAADVFRGRYHLVVSSPGLDRPLKMPRQYPKNVGKNLILKINKNDQMQKVEGILIEASNDGIIVREEDESTRAVLFNDIVEAYVDTPW
jgi:ribosome maturation factor RimP